LKEAPQELYFGYRRSKHFLSNPTCLFLIMQSYLPAFSGKTDNCAYYVIIYRNISQVFLSFLFGYLSFSEKKK
jgi:hypothetical protein